MVSQCFWALATLVVTVSIGVEAWIWMTRKRWHESQRLTILATGHRKDIWLVCSIVWIVLISDYFSSWSIFDAAGAAALLWLLWRTSQRLQFFVRGR